MTAMLANEVWTLRIGCYTPTQQAINVVNYLVASIGGGGAQDGVAVGDLNALIAAPFKAVLSDDARYRGCSLQRRQPIPPTVAAITTISDGPGDVAGEILPGQVSGIIRFKTAFAGPALRGRVFIPFPGEADNEVPGVPTASYQARLQALANVINQTIVVGVAGNTSTLKPIIFHRETNTHTLVTTADARIYWGTQRRRSSFGQPNPAPF